MNRGGARTGSGRKPALNKEPVNFKLDKGLLKILRAKVPMGQRTKFVEATLAKELGVQL